MLISENKDFIYIWEPRTKENILGFGSLAFYVARIESALAREIIRKHHYSKKVVNNSYLNLGVYKDGQLEGVMQFGYAKNCKYTSKLMDGLGTRDYMELNRMWFSEVCPRNSESQALSFAMRIIRKLYPSVIFVQSFADERCGRLGVVYQAANFKYYGEHKTDFYEIDGEVFHQQAFTTFRRKGKPIGETNRYAWAQRNKDRAIKSTYRQFRYIYWVKPFYEARFKLKECAYPKPKS